MNENERKEAIIRYSERLKKFGPISQALGWKDETQQKLRFQIFAECIQIDDDTSILDVGCGFGDFYDYLKLDGIDFIYEGCDISPEIIGIAKELRRNIRFQICDLRDGAYLNQSFDYVCISGIFNFKISNNEKFLQETLVAAYSICKKGVIVNMTTDKVDFKDPLLHYYNPGKVVDFCSSLTRRMIIRHDYPLFEFTLGLYRP
jgi:SAM-dependent methyltransferase